MLPPIGRHSVRYRLAGVHARSRLVNIWPYLVGDLEPYRHNENLTRVMSYEMLAAGALPMPHPGNPKTLDHEEAYSELFEFLGKARTHFGTRVPLARTGIYYSSSSLLAFMAPGGFVDFNRRPHQFGYYGWATALHDLHEPYVPVPEWKLNAETLSGLDLLIVPNAIVTDDAERVLKPWTAKGGRVLITGDSGMRGGESENFALHHRGALHQRLEGAYHVDENVGMRYYLEHESRESLGPLMAKHLNAARSTTTPLIDAPDVPSTVGLTPYWDAEQHALFVDVNNLAIDLDSDTVTPTQALAFDIELPDSLHNQPLAHRVISPETGVETSVSPRGETGMQIEVGPLRYYCSIMLVPEK
jgi:hypothetical protein